MKIVRRYIEGGVACISVQRRWERIILSCGIVNDANDWAIDTMHNPKYPLELVQRVITVSLETMKIVRELPELEI